MMEGTNDAMSVVTDTTRDSDETRQDLGIMLNGIYGCKDMSPGIAAHRPMTTSYENLVTDESRGSPMYPVQQNFKIKLSSNPNSLKGEGDNGIPKAKETTISAVANSDSLSDSSQPLIPLLKPGTVRRSSRKACPSKKKQEDLKEASQSLLPQTFSERSQLFANRGHMFSLSSSLRHSSAKYPIQHSLVRTTQPTESSKGYNLFPCSQRETTQSAKTSMGDKWMQSSQNDQTQRASNATDKICIRLEKLLSSLSCSTSKQKRVMEITVHQCVRKLQDNIFHRLKKIKVEQNQQASMKKLLQTIQCCLTKLYQHYKAERTMAAQGTIQQSQHLSKLDTSHIIQTTLSELQQRQQELHTLLKQQKKLVEKLKASIRNQTSSRQFLVNDNDKKVDASAKEEDKTVSSQDQQSNQICDSQNEQFQFSQLSNIYPYNEMTQQSHLSVSDLFSSTQNENQLPETQNEKTTLQKNDNVSENPKSNDEREQSSEAKRRKYENAKLSDEEKKLPHEAKEKSCKDTKSLEEIEEQTSEAEGEGSNAAKKSDESADKPLSISQDIDLVPDTQDLHSIHVSPSSLDQLQNDTQYAIPDGLETCLTNERVASKELSKAISLVESGMQTAFHSKPNCQPYSILAKDMEDNSLRKVTQKGDNSVISKKDDGRGSNKKDNSLASEKDIGRISGKSNNPLSPKQSKNKKLRNNLSDDNDNKIEEQSSYSEMLWLSMFHTSQDNNIRISSSSRAEKDQTEEKKKPESNNKGQHINKESYITNTSKNHKISLNTDDNLYRHTRGKERALDAFQEKEIVGHLSKTEPQFRLPSFLSPPRYHMEDDMADNVSPTATSMSSDVFLVKAKELNRRMKMREKLAEKKTPAAPTETQVEKNTHPTNVTKYVGQSSAIRFAAKHADSATNVVLYPEQIQVSERNRDTITEAIESVVAKSRTATAEQMLDHVYMFSEKPWSDLQAPLYETLYHQQIGQNSEMVKPKAGCLPSIGSLLKSKIVLPGKNVLSVFIKGLLHQTSITPAGKLRTREGMLFNTPMQWLSTLTDGLPKKKRMTYKQILYKGRPLIEVCRIERENKEHSNTMKTVKTIQCIHKVDRAVQAELQVSDTEIGKESSTVPRTEEELILNRRLTQSVIRLLTDEDFVNCEDLPRNFWTEDYVNVTLDKAMWDVVDKW